MENSGNILSVSPFHDDHRALEAIFRQGPEASAEWTLSTSATAQRAIYLLKNVQMPILICERDLQPGTWKDLLEGATQMVFPPLLIVTSRLADEHLWAEVLNLGGWDVLAKPFDATEVMRVVETAWRRWHNQRRAQPSERQNRLAAHPITFTAH